MLELYKTTTIRERKKFVCIERERELVRAKRENLRSGGREEWGRERCKVQHHITTPLCL
ncbi:hypothetical protein GIB67_016229 [Kingdonia uniflora]|uniref:Uncharacterized protein n=1 Tax=Kingdonia uniflora TaxID=39325 RepID=A0A7J7LTD2_9MAGN|nr:hypothetical protein GIB67_016229 [Kingdonia uniflora]